MKRIALSLILFPTLAFAESGGGLSWKAPPSWTVDPPRPMRAATYTIAPAKGDVEAAELGVFYFGKGQGGSVEDNVKRWSGQFEGGKPATTKQQKVGTLAVTRVAIEGTYVTSAGGPMMGAGPQIKKPSWELLGAIVDGPEGPVFFKLTGPKKTVDATKAAFDGVIKSIAVEKH